MKQKEVARKFDVDQLESLINDETERSLMVLKRAINILKKNGISYISQIKTMYEERGEIYLRTKLTGFERLGKKMVEDIMTRAVCYDYPEGYHVEIKELPEWYFDDSNPIKKATPVKKEDLVSMEELESLCDEPEIAEISMEELETLCPDDQVDTEETNEDIEDPLKSYPKYKMSELEALCADDVDAVAINVNEYSKNLIDEEELPALVVSLFFDIFDDEEHISPERVFAGMTNYSQNIAFYTDQRAYVSKDYFIDFFNTKTRNLKTINNLGQLKMLYVGLENADCIIKSVGENGFKYCWGRKPKVLGRENKLNYIEIKIMDAEAFLNRKLNIATKDQIEDIRSMFFTDTAIPKNENKPVNRNHFYLIPLSCKEGVFNFKAIKIKNKMNFANINEITGSYMFNANDPGNGNLLLPRCCGEEDYDLIMGKIKEFFEL